MKLVELIDNRLILVVFDLDDTLITTDSKIGVLKGGKFSKHIDPTTFAQYTLQPGESFDFSEFDTTLKNPHHIDNIMRIFKKSLQNKQTRTFILTARGEKKPVEDFLKGIGASIVKVIAINSNDPNKKKEWISNQLKRNIYKKVIFIDDSIKNLHSVASLRMRFPNTKIITFTVR